MIREHDDPARAECPNDGPDHDVCSLCGKGEERTPATIQPSITGDAAGLWLFESIHLQDYDDVDAANVAALNINAAFNEWLTVRAR